MRMTILATAALAGSVALSSFGAATPSSAQSRPARTGTAAAPSVPDPALQPPEPGEADDQGGAGYLPGARFQRRLDGGPGFVCTATNALHTDQCTASCRKDETADCVDADGSGAPSCSCVKG